MTGANRKSIGMNSVVPSASTLDPPASFGDHLIHPKSIEWKPEKEKVIMAPYDYLLEHPGKDIRAQLISAFNEWLHVPPESLKIITKVIGMLHTASLL